MSAFDNPFNYKSSTSQITIEITSGEKKTQTGEL